MIVYVVLLLCAISGSQQKIPDYIEVCKRDPNTINECVLDSIEKLRPKLKDGIPELGVPGIEPFYIPEIVVDTGNLVQFSAIGKDVKVTGASNFNIKSLDVDLDTLTFRGRVRFPKLHFNGKYKVDGRLLVVPIHGQGTIIADAMKCEAELVLKAERIDRNGLQYIKFTSLDVDVKIKDYRLRLEGLFDGDKALGQAANEAINQNRAEFLKASKPYIERTVSKHILDIANKVVANFSVDELLPEP